MYKDLSAIALREQIKVLLENQRLHGIFDTPYDQILRFPDPQKYGYNGLTNKRDFLYQYFRLSLLAQHAGYLQERSLDNQTTHEGHPLALALTSADLRHSILPIALAAWLSPDEWRWESKYGAPEDLYYGLVLEYPTYVLAIASYTLKLNREELNRQIAPETVAECERIAEISATQSLVPIKAKTIEQP